MFSIPEAIQNATHRNIQKIKIRIFVKCFSNISVPLAQIVLFNNIIVF